MRQFWSGQWDSNPRPSRWQRDALPLSYARMLKKHYKERFLEMQAIRKLIKSDTY